MKAIKYLLLALLVLPLSGFARNYTLTLLAEPAQGGSVSGGGSYEAGTVNSISATTAYYYSFVGWYDEDSNLISSEKNISYQMPEHDVTLKARFRFSPSLPDEPQAPDTSEPETTYRVDLATYPPSAGTISTTTYNQVAGSTISVNCSVNSYYTFLEWRNELGETVSTEKSFQYTVPERDSKLTAYFRFTPSTPADPGSFNSWDPFSGELTLLKLTSIQSACDELISTEERSLVKKITIADPAFNSTNANLYFIGSYLTAVEVVDLKNTQFTSYGSYSLQIPSMKKLVLPAGSLSFNSSAFNSTSNANLEEILIYATVPPTEGASCLNYVPETCIIYVPNESVDAYKAATYWCDFDIRPMISEDNAVGPEDSGWNDLSLLHKLPFAYTYTGANGGRIEYMVENDGEWLTLCSDLENNQEVSMNALAQFTKSRSVHTIDFRVVDGATVTPLPELQVSLVDLGYKAVTVAGPNYYDYGNAVEPQVTVTDVAAERYAVAYINNIKVGRATARVAGVYPYTINTRSNTFDIAQLPLPGDIEFVDPEVSLVYTGDFIRPDWQFTDVRNRSLVNNTDYTFYWSHSYSAGIQTLTVTGKGQFTGTIVLEYEILKGPIISNAYTYGINYPATEILYDGSAHGFYNSYSPSTSYSGQPIFEYYDHETGEKLDAAPTAVGEYEGWMGFEEGPNTVYTAPTCQIVYTIFDMTDAEWEALQTLSADLASRGYETGWNFSDKINSLRFAGATVKKGWLTEINLPDKSMTGTFPESLFAFNNLKRINFSGNRLSGSFDGEVRTFPNAEYVDLTNNLFSGDLTALAARFPNASTIKASGNRLSTVSAPLPATVTTLEIARQTTGAAIDLDFTGNSLSSFFNVVPSIVRYDHANREFASSLDLWLTTTDYKDVAQLPASQWAMKLTDGGVVKVSDNVMFTADNGATLHVLAADNSWFDAAFTFILGDTNFDRSVSVLDVQGAINMIFDEVDTDAPFNCTAADIKVDGDVNIFDVATIVKTVINSAPAAAPMLKAQSMAANSLAYCTDGSLMISSAEPVAAFDITVAGAQLPRNIPQLDAAGFNYSINGGRIVAYSLSGATLPQGISEIATIDSSEAYVAYVELSNSKAKAITENAGVSGIDSLDADATDDNGEWYNLQGIRIARPTAPGIYIHNNQKITIR